MAGQEPTPDLPAIPWKTCTKCGESKPETAFAFQITPKRQSRCKACFVAINKAQRAAHGEENKARQAIYYATHRQEVIDKAKAYYAKLSKEERDRRRSIWHEAHPEEVRAYQAAWRAAHPEKRRLQAVAWHAANPEKVLIHHTRRKARKAGLPDTFTPPISPSRVPTGIMLALSAAMRKGFTGHWRWITGFLSKARTALARSQQIWCCSVMASAAVIRPKARVSPLRGFSGVLAHARRARS